MSQYLVPEEIQRGIPQKVYEQIYEQLKRELVLNNYETGERFFSYRKLKALYKTELRTIAAAVDLLIQDGLLEKRSTSGIYVTRKETLSEVGNIWYAVLSDFCYHPFSHHILLGLVQEAEKYGLRVIVHFGNSPKEFLHWFSPEPGEGLVITGDLNEAILKAAGKKCRDNMIVAGNYGLTGNFGQVTTNCHSMIRESLEKAAASGCRHFGLIVGRREFKITKDILEIVEEFAREGGFPLEITEERDENGLKGMENLAKFKPDCVLVTEPAFSGAWEFMMSHSLRSPEDIFLIRYGKEAKDNTLAGRAAIDLEINSELHGRTALQMLLKGNKDIRKVDMQMTSHIQKGENHA